eukprot:7470181-Pyramimonas_sp.AAC.1
MGLVCKALWTYDRAEKAGHKICNVCPLCGQAGDAVHHRLRRCPCVAFLREEHVKPDIPQSAADAD